MHLSVARLVVAIELNWSLVPGSQFMWGLGMLLLWQSAKRPPNPSVSVCINICGATTARQRYDDHQRQFINCWLIFIIFCVLLGRHTNDTTTPAEDNNDYKRRTGMSTTPGSLWCLWGYGQFWKTSFFPTSKRATEFQIQLNNRWLLDGEQARRGESEVGLLK